MLLRVDVYSNTFNVDSTTTSEQLKSQESLLISLNTSSSSTVLTVGRKDAGVVFGADKSVSRQHMALELVSSRDFVKIDDKTLPRSPQGTEECNACRDHEIICVLKDTSKFGTFLVCDDKTQSKMAHDDSTCDDSTDDERHGSSPPQGSQLSSVASKLINSPDASLLKIEEQLILTKLNQQNGRVVIQVGQNGSTLVIQNIPIRIVLSRVNKKIKDLWSSRCYLLGMAMLESVDASITHLVTDARVTNAKSLTAWCLSKPLVTIEFLEALWNRTSHKDPLPDSAKFATPEADDGLTFWKDIPNPNLWSDATMLSFGPRNDDMEALCRAAGATIVELDKHDDPIKAIDDCVNAKKECFCVQSTCKSHAKLVKHLKSLQVAFVTQKMVALCVSQQAPLKGDSSNQLVATSRPILEKPMPILPSSTPTLEASFNARKSSRLTPARPLPQETPSSLTQITARAPHHRQAPLALEDDDDFDDEEELPKEFSRSHRKSTRLLSPRETRQSQRLREKSTTHVDDDELPQELTLSQASPHPEDATDGILLGSSNSQRETYLTMTNEDKTVPVSDYWDEQGPPVQKKAKKSLGGWTDVRQARQEKESANATKSSSMSEDDDDAHDKDVPQHRSKAQFAARRALPTTGDGWLVAAPKERTEFKATEAEILDALGDVDELPPLAETDVVEGLVVEAKAQATAFHRVRNGVKDFRRFRKNPVIRGCDVSHIQMRIVLPKVSDRLMEIQEEQAALEASLREADMLFQDSNRGLRGQFKQSSRLRMREV